MSGEIRRVKRELAYHGTVIDVYKDYMEFENGGTEEWDYIHHNGAAAVVPVLDDGRLLMVTQYRNALDRLTLEIPAGKLDYPEEPGIACAKRELEEETGYRSEQLEWLLTLRTTVALCNERIEIFVARNLIPSKQKLDEGEYVTVKAYTVEELKQKIYTGEIEDSKTVSAILAYADKFFTFGA
ncbi:MAG: NUDIX hydrolase [Lachnospiraceae bacterium]